jgi:hypothetical protein
MRQAAVRSRGRATGDRQTEPYNEHFKKSSAKSTRQGNVKVNSKPVESEGFTKH